VRSRRYRPRRTHRRRSNADGRVIRSSSARRVVAALIAWIALSATGARAQTVSERGFIDLRGQAYAEKSPRDPGRLIADLLVREEVFVRASWLRLTAGVDLRGNSHEQVESEWRFDFSDRGIQRPRAAVRRLTAGISTGHVSIDVGKQFIRWGRADILNPTDRFTPRDYLTVVDTELLPILGARAAVQAGSETFEAVWVPRFTPSRLPLLGQRWTVLPPEAAAVTIVDRGSLFPERSQFGARWSHAGGRAELALSVYDGFSNLPNIETSLRGVSTIDFVRTYPRLRSYGAELAIPTPLVTLKGETALFTSPTGLDNEFLIYVVELERQVGEWIFDGGYAGEVVTRDRGTRRFAPDEGVARSFIGRVSYTIGPRRSVAVEGAARQSGDGVYVKGEYSEALGQHWRVTFAGVGIGGNDEDFLGQYRHNSYGSIGLRLSF
jgi:hypothetical protein